MPFSFSACLCFENRIIKTPAQPLPLDMDSSTPLRITRSMTESTPIIVHMDENMPVNYSPSLKPISNVTRPDESAKHKINSKQKTVERVLEDVEEDKESKKSEISKLELRSPAKTPGVNNKMPLKNTPRPIRSTANNSKVPNQIGRASCRERV